jgi:RND family efflux transporter MFP subunit
MADPTTAPTLAAPRPTFWVRAAWAGLLLVGGLCAAGARYVMTHHGHAAEEKARAAVLAVTTVLPKKQTLLRTVEQPGSILPFAQAELYAKTSGYLRSIRREVTAEVAADLLTRSLLSPAALGAPAIGQACGSAAALATSLWQAPVIDIGAKVTAGDILVEVDVPERMQDVVERGAFVRQREEELGQTKTAVGTYLAMVEVANAQLKQAEADIKRYQSEYAFRMKELARFRDLVNSRALEARLFDEKQSHADAALAALESSRAKLLSSRADLTLATSKLATARADVKVKQALLEVAKADLERARILLDYSRLEAPFSGFLTYRGVDEGDFVQNSQSGQSRHLMTVTALDKVKVNLKVPSREGVLVRVGADAVVTVDSRPGEKFVGRVSRTRRVLDAQSRTLEVEIDLDNRHQKLMPGMYGHVVLSLESLPDTWTIPATALFSRNKVNYVILVQNGVAKRQPVRIVLDNGHEVGVVKLIGSTEVPLDGTEELVVSGKGEIGDGQRVTSPARAGR